MSNCKYNTEEERKEAKKQALKKYRESEKGKKTAKRYYEEVVKQDEDKMNKIREQSKEWHKNHKISEEKKILYAKKRKIKYWTDKTFRENISQLKKKYYINNKNKVNEYYKKYYEEHKTEIAERKRQWRLKKLLEQKKEN